MSLKRLNILLLRPREWLRSIAVFLKIEINKVHEIHSNVTSAKYRNPRNPQTVRNPH